MMTSDQIDARGVISVISNVAPGPVTKMVHAPPKAETWTKQTACTPHYLKNPYLVEWSASHPKNKHLYGVTEVKARNPLPVKTLMNILGMPAGPCRQPLGKMNRAGPGHRTRHRPRNTGQ